MQSKLLKYGHTPVYLEASNDEYRKLILGELPFYRQKWKRINIDKLSHEKGEEGVEVKFEHTLKSTFKSTDHLLIAYIYPYTYLDML